MSHIQFKDRWNSNFNLHSSLLTMMSFRPAGVQNFRFVVLKKKDRVQDEMSSWSGLFENVVYIVGMTGFIIWCMKKQYISLTGRHKKYEGDYYYDNASP